MILFIFDLYDTLDEVEPSGTRDLARKPLHPPYNKNSQDVLSFHL